MIRMTLNEVITAVGGEPADLGGDAWVSGISTDSRRVERGQVFFAISGERFDGHDYVDQAWAAGARACVVSRPVGSSAGRCIHVDDTVAALARLAAEHRRRLRAPVIAVTGSNGKTTTKGMIDHVLRTRLKGRAAVKSFNNHVGVPLTLLSAEADDEYLVVEIGSNAPGEVGHLAGMAAPDVGVIVSIGPAHLEGLGGLEGVVAEKTSLLERVRAGGLAVVNADMPEMRAWLEGCKTLSTLELITFGKTGGVDLRVTEVHGDLTGTRFRINAGPEIRLPICGEHNALNATAALAVSRHLGLAADEIAAALASYQPEDMRLKVSRHGSITVINDSYNANPASMTGAIDVLVSSSGRRRVLVVGDMLELGDEAAAWHERIGGHAGRSGVDLVVAVGLYADTVADAAGAANPAIEARTYADAESAGADLAAWLRAGDVLLVKGSRAVGMERVAGAVAAFVADGQERGARHVVPAVRIPG